MPTITISSLRLSLIIVIAIAYGTLGAVTFIELFGRPGANVTFMVRILFVIGPGLLILMWSVKKQHFLWGLFGVLLAVAPALWASNNFNTDWMSNSKNPKPTLLERTTQAVKDGVSGTRQTLSEGYEGGKDALIRNYQYACDNLGGWDYGLLCAEKTQSTKVPAKKPAEKAE
jgi:hypothetical protein